MSPKLVLSLALVTLFTALAAAVAVWTHPELSRAPVGGEPAFPLLRQYPGDVARIVVADRNGRVTVERSGDGTWIVADKHGYPADSSKVRELAVTLADMRLIEAKTAKPERFPRLEVEDVDGVDAASRTVRVQAADGTVLAEAVIGKRVFSVTGARESGTYVRRTGDVRAWLASGGLAVRADADHWLLKTIVDIAADRVREMVVMPAAGDGYVAARDDRDEDLELASVPEGRTVRADEVKRLASALTAVAFEDVAPAGAVEMPAEASSLTVTTFEGLDITVESAEVEGRRWAVLSARARPAEGGEESEAARDAAEAITQRSTGWVYQLSPYVADRLTRPLEELLEPPTPEDGTS